MKWLRQIHRRLKVLFRRERFDRDLAEEMQSHVEMEAEEEGPEARRRFGNLTLLGEQSREVWGWRWLDELARDTRFTLRMLRKSPGLTAVSILTLSLGIGANTAVYSLISKVWFHPFPIPHAERLLWIRSENPARRVQRSRVSWTEFRALERSGASLSSIAAFQFDGYNLSGLAEPVRVSGLSATRDFFATLAVQPFLGRSFVDGEERVAVLSYGFWQRQFGGQPGVVGKTIRLDGIPHTVAGIMPQGFWFPDPGIEVFRPLPLSAESDGLSRRDLLVIAKLRPHVPLASAQAECDVVVRNLTPFFPESERGWRLRSVPTARLSASDLASGALLAGVVGTLLLIACLNVATLLLARALDRQREFAMRAALGAGRSRLLRQCVVEGLVLSVLAGIAGLLVGLWSTRLLGTVYAAVSPLLEAARVDARAVVVTVLLTLATGVLVGLGPLWRARRFDQGERDLGVSGAPRSTRLHRAFVAAEVALATTLLIVCGLLLRTLRNLQSQRLGFEPRQVLTAGVSPDELKFPTAAGVTEFFRGSLAEISAQRGVLAAGGISRLPTTGGAGNRTRTFSMGGTTTVRGWAQDVVVTPGYFASMRIPLLRGRDFRSEDRQSAPNVAVVNQTASDRYWPGGDPLGDTILFDPDGLQPLAVTVVGVVGDIRNDDASEPPVPMVYLPHAQHPVRLMYLTVRSSTASSDTLFGIRSTIRAVDGDQPIFGVATMEQLVRRDLSGTRMVVEMLGVFGLMALVLTTVGVYSVVWHWVRARASEIGIRVALGSSALGVLRIVLGQAMRVLLTGIAAGLLLGLGVTHGIRSLLYGVQPTDLMTWAAMVAVITGAALSACTIPAYRAARIDPMEALRHE